MAAGLILTFTGRGRADYEKVNANLGMDMTSPNASWPSGLMEHTSGTTDAGELVVCEMWESRDAQARFMQERLGPALGKAGLGGDRPNIEWFDVIVSSNPQVAAKA